MSIRGHRLISFYARLIAFFFTFVGLWVALPLIVWDLAKNALYTPLAILLAFLATFLPIALITWFNIEDDPTDEKVPYRVREDAAVRASIATGVLLGFTCVLWSVV